MTPSPRRAELHPDDACGTLPLPSSAADDAGATLPLTPEGDTAPLSAPAQTVEKIGRFLIRAKLGEGAFGSVYRAFDPQLEREVALKVAKPGAVDSPERRERFAREARSAAGLQHPYIVPVFDSGEDAGRFYIASRLIDGRTLRDEIDAEDGLPMDLIRATKIIMKLAEALGYAHENGVIHRDVKPENVLIRGHGELMLADFGLALRACDRQRAGTGGQAEESIKAQDNQILGTPAYMSPEQAAGRSAEATGAMDQYALGVILYELVTGRRPFEGSAEVVQFQHMSLQPKPPRSTNPQVSHSLEIAILKCLAKEPTERYASCGDLMLELERIHNSLRGYLWSRSALPTRMTDPQIVANYEESRGGTGRAPVPPSPDNLRTDTTRQTLIRRIIRLISKEPRNNNLPDYQILLWGWISQFQSP